MEKWPGATEFNGRVIALFQKESSARKPKGRQASGSEAAVVWGSEFIRLLNLPAKSAAELAVAFKCI